MTDKHVFQCQCGKQYSVSREQIGREFLCSGCSLKIRVPGEILPNTTHSPTLPTKESRFDWKLLGTGIFCFVGGVIAVAITILAFVNGGRIRITTPIVGAVLILIGGGSLIKAIGGDAIEWD